MNQIYSEEDCIESLREAAEILGESPSQTQYKKLDISPTHFTITNRLGSWNEAKEKAGLKTFGRAPRTDWPEEYEKLFEGCDNRHKKVRRKYVSDIKSSRGCQRCGFNESPVSLDFHHTNAENKDKQVSKLVRNAASFDKIDEEIEKCEVLCANCHRIVENK